MINNNSINYYFEAYYKLISLVKKKGIVSRKIYFDKEKLKKYLLELKNTNSLFLILDVSKEQLDVLQLNDIKYLKTIYFNSLLYLIDIFKRYLSVSEIQLENKLKYLTSKEIRKFKDYLKSSNEQEIFKYIILLKNEKRNKQNLSEFFDINSIKKQLLRVGIAGFLILNLGGVVAADSNKQFTKEFQSTSLSKKQQDLIDIQQVLELRKLIKYSYFGKTIMIDLPKFDILSDIPWKINFLNQNKEISKVVNYDGNPQKMAFGSGIYDITEITVTLPSGTTISLDKFKNK